MKVKLKLFFKWGIEFEQTPYIVPLRDNGTAKYASKELLMQAVYMKYKHGQFDSVATKNASAGDGTTPHHHAEINALSKPKGIKLNENVSDEEVIG